MTLRILFVVLSAGCGGTLPYEQLQEAQQRAQEACKVIATLPQLPVVSEPSGPQEGGEAASSEPGGAAGESAGGESGGPAQPDPAPGD